MCAAKGWEFKPWEWPRPYHDLGPPEPGENEHTRKARRLRAQLLAELEAGE